MASRTRTIRLLITGFGPFPGAAENPTGPLVRALARRLRADKAAKITAHVFRTSYAAVDRDLPRLLARAKPDVLLMFGLATGSRAIRVETQARNRIGRHADAAGVRPKAQPIVKGAPRVRPLRAPKRALLRAAKSGPVPARLSLNAGTYLCNYLYWRALEQVRAPAGPKRAVFIHVPPVVASRPGRSLQDLAAPAQAIALTLIRSVRTPRR